MARVKDRWYSEVKEPDGRKTKKKTARHPDNGGNKESKRWLAVWLDPDGREKSKAFAIKEKARQYARRMEEDVVRGEYIAPKAGDGQFDSYGRRWLNSRGNLDPATVIRYEQVFRIHVEPTFGARKVRTVRPSEIQEFLTELGSRFGPSTPEAALRILQGVFDLAVADGAIRESPAKSPVVKLARRGVEKIVAWPDETVFRIIDAHPDDVRAMPVLGAACGMREGEWFGLAEEDVDFDSKVLHVRRQIKVLRRNWVFALPKNDRVRTVPLSDWAASYLQTHINRYKPRPYTLPWERVNGLARTHNLLFRWPTDDKHVRHGNYGHSIWKPVLAKIGVIPPAAKGPRGRKRYTDTRGKGTHQLRHWYASVSLADGVNIKELAEYLGHADPAFTLEIYSHMLPDSHERARQAIDRRMRRPRLVG